jgi:hypothetical protein
MNIKVAVIENGLRFNKTEAPDIVIKDAAR